MEPIRFTPNTCRTQPVRFGREHQVTFPANASPEDRELLQDTFTRWVKSIGGSVSIAGLILDVPDKHDELTGAMAPTVCRRVMGDKAFIGDKAFKYEKLVH